MSPTMEDIARRLGIAKSTVSLALNDRPGVSSEMREAILGVAQAIGYRLPERRSTKHAPDHRAFAVIYHVVQESESEPAGVALGYLNGIQSIARQNQISLTVLTDHPGGGVQRFALQFLDQANPSPEGLIVMGAGLRRTSPFVKWASERSVPIVAISRSWPDVPVSTVSQDHVEQAQIALVYLTQLGHRKIGFVARCVDQDCDWFDIRLSCYRQVLECVGEPFDDTLVAIGEDGQEAIERLLTVHPDVTAILGIYDRVAVEAMQGIRALGLEMPRDLSIIGLDDADKPPVGYPALTTVGFSHFGAGYLAAKLLIDQIEQPDLCYGRIVLRSQLIERASCDRPREGQLRL